MSNTREITQILFFSDTETTGRPISLGYERRIQINFPAEGMRAPPDVFGWVFVRVDEEAASRQSFGGLWLPGRTYIRAENLDPQNPFPDEETARRWKELDLNHIVRVRSELCARVGAPYRLRPYQPEAGDKIIQETPAWINGPR